MDNTRFSAQTNEERQLDIGELTILEKEEQDQAKRQHRQNQTKKQSGFKGKSAFIAKPAEIAFRDFTVGKVHTLVITLTNVSNAFNSFKVLPLPENIRNYFQVEYHPKGKISPGISCDIKFKFFPQLNQDIFSEFTIIAETGHISYPIVCTYRKTILRCPDPCVRFGRIIYGQSKTVKLLIKNEGSLPSQYSFINTDKSELGLKNSAQQLEIIQNLNFEHRSDIEANIQKSIPFDFSPKQIGPFEFNILLAAKNPLHSPPIAITVEGQCVEVPVRVQKKCYDLQICLLGHIYRQKIRFYNKSEGPVSFKMSQGPETKKYFEFNPVIGYIQKESTIDIWVKLAADKDLPNFLSRYRHENDVYIIPFQMNVKEQVLPVEFDIRFKITSDRINIRPSELNFGKIFQGLSSKIEVQLQNQSELPQQILLYPLKKSIAIENDQAIFKLLPRQTIRTSLIYRSKLLEESKSFKEEDYIGVKIITGQIATNKIDIHYSCQVVRPDLSITHNKIDLPALQIGQITQASTILKNQTNKEILFQIFVPDFQVCGLRVTPVVKALSPKQETQITVQYHSFFKTLSYSLLSQISSKKHSKLSEEKVEDKKEEQEKKEVKKDTKKEAKLTKQQQQQLQLQQKRLQEEERLRKERQQQEKLELERNFDSQSELTRMGGKLYSFGQTQHYQWLLPVYFKQKDYSDVSTEVHFIQVTSTSIQQVLSIDKPEIDFGQIAVGTRTVREVVISNSGPKAQLKKKTLPIFCSFNVLNSLRQVSHEKSCKIAIQFQPIEEQVFSQRITFFTQQYTVSCKVKGKGVRPEIQVEPQNGLVNMGGVLVDQVTEKIVKIKNICNFDVGFCLQKIGEGALNLNSGSPFSYVPSEGTVPAHGSIDIKVRFRPDRISQRFFQKIKVHVEQQKTVRYFYISGSCYNRQAFVTLYKAPSMPQDAEMANRVQGNFDWLRVKDQDTVFSPNRKGIVLEFPKGDSSKEQKTFQRKITVGSCKLLDNKLEKPTAFEIILPKDDRFQCDNLKGAAAPGTETVVTFTYKPQDSDPLVSCIPELGGIGQWKELKGELKLSGGFIKPGATDQVSFDIILKFYVNQL